MTSTVIYPDIAVIGRAGAGKTTLAELLVKDYGYRRMSFAAPLKIMCGTQTDRDILQRVGVAVRDLTNGAAWVRLLEHTLAERPELAQPVVIDDCRFPNEAQMLAEYGFRFIRVAAGRNTRLARLQANGKLQDEAQLEHVSETSLDEFSADVALYNNGDPRELNDGLGRVVGRWLR